jgi:hypothetical protein
MRSDALRACSVRVAYATDNVVQRLRAALKQLIYVPECARGVFSG